MKKVSNHIEVDPGDMFILAASLLGIIVRLYFVMLSSNAQSLLVKAKC